MYTASQPSPAGLFAAASPQHEVAIVLEALQILAQKSDWKSILWGMGEASVGGIVRAYGTRWDLQQLKELEEKARTATTLT